MNNIAPNLASAHPDAKLLELGNRLEVIWAAERAMWRMRREIDFDFSTEAETIKLTDAVCDMVDDVVRKIGECQATTLDGLRVKARAACWSDPEIMNPRSTDADDPVRLLLANIIGDVSPWDAV